MRKIACGLFILMMACLASSGQAASWKVADCVRNGTCPDQFTASPTMTPSLTPDFSSPTPSITGTPPTSTMTPEDTLSPTFTMTPSISATPTVTRTLVADAVAVRINAGGSAAYGAWAQDQAYGSGYGFTLGKAYSTDHAVQGTSAAPLYQAFRQGSVVEYKVDVAPGIYQVTLKMCDFVSTGSDQRVFKVIAQGQTREESLDVYALAGGATAFDRVLDVQVNSGPLVLRLEALPGKGAAFISAVEVLGLQSIHSPTPTPTPNVTPLDITLEEPPDAVLVP
jgi:hypothetical protein